MKSFYPLLCIVFPFLLQAQHSNTPVEILIEKAAVAKIELDGSPDFLAVDGDDVWISNIDRVQKLSVKSKKPVLTVTIPGACGAMIVGAKSLWVASCREQAVYRIDSRTGKILSVINCGVADLQGEISLAFGAGSLWIASDNKGVVTRIDAKTNTIQAHINVLPDSYCAVYNYKSVWISNTAAHSVQRIDPKTNKVVATISVGKTPRFLAAGENGVWTLNQDDGTVSRIDPQSNSVVATIDANAIGTGGDIDAGGNRVWVRAKSRLLQTVNSETNSIETIYIPAAGSGAVRVTDHFVWVTAHDINTIWVMKK